MIFIIYIKILFTYRNILTKVTEGCNVTLSDLCKQLPSARQCPAMMPELTRCEGRGGLAAHPDNVLFSILDRRTLGLFSMLISMNNPTEIFGLDCICLYHITNGYLESISP
jgi:hypothetical protein